MYLQKIVCHKGDNIRRMAISLEISSNTVVCVWSFLHEQRSLYCEQDQVMTPWTILFALILMVHL